jgi:hypothetical protein
MTKWPRSRRAPRAQVVAGAEGVTSTTRLFRIPHNRANDVEPLQSIFPGYQAPVVRRAADGERELVVLNRGFVLLQKDRAPRRVITGRHLVGRPFSMRIVQNRWEQPFFRPIIGSGDCCRPIPNSRAGGRVERVHEKGAKTDSGDHHCGQGNHHKAHLTFLSEVRSTRYERPRLRCR